MYEELAIQVLARAGFTEPEAGAILHAVAKLPVDARIELADDVVTSLKGRAVRLILEGCDPFTLDRNSGLALCLELATDPSAKVRLKLARTLGGVDWPGGVPLLKALAQDRDLKVRRTAAVYLVAMGLKPAAAFPLKRRRIVLRDETLDLSPIFETTLRGGTVFRSPTAVCPVVPQGVGLADEEPIRGVEPARGGPAAGDSSAAALPAAALTRYTHVDFAPRANEPAAGDLTFALLVQAGSAEAHPVDLRVAAGRPHAMVLVHAHSADFDVAPGTRTIRLPRNGDSQAAVFGVRARAAGSGVVSLMVYDEFHLAGSIEVRLRAVEGAQGLALEQEGTVVWRDPAASVPVAQLGLTVQASLAEQGTGRVAYHTLVRDEKKGIGVPRLVPLGRSSEPFDAETVQASLAALRAEVDEIEKGLDNPQTLGAGSAEEVMEGLRINFESAGRQLGGDILSSEVRALVASRAAGSVVHWVIHDRALDAVPWELACDPDTGRPLAEDIVLVRMPVHGDPDADAAPGAPAASAAEPAAGPGRLLYVLGSGVGGPALFPRLRTVVKAAKGYQVETNFDGPQRQAVNLVKLKKLVQGARVVHVLCHGMVEEEKGLFLAIEAGALGRVNPHQVLTFEPAPGALVFINACSSAAATFSPAGLTTFGWNFLRAGAGAYVGTLAPVTTPLALRFAEAFFDAHLGEGAPVAEAIFRARQALKGDPDPTWMLYALYADLHAPTPSPT